MHCLKCGKETDSQQSFCESCLKTMDAYPINADAKVILPNRPAFVKTAARKRPPQPEELLAAMQRKLRRALTALAVVCLLLGLSVAALIYTYQNSETPPVIGRNYNIVTSEQP